MIFTRPLLAFLVLTPLQAAVAQEGKSVLPEDVAKFVEHRDICDKHRKQIHRGLTSEQALDMVLNCQDTDENLALLKSKYSKNKTVMKVLGRYEENVLDK